MKRYGGLDIRGDIEKDGTLIWDTSNGYIPQGRLENTTVSVAGNNVALGGSVSVDHVDLSNIGTDDHHSRYTDSEAESAINNDADHSSTASHDHTDLTTVNPDQHHARDHASRHQRGGADELVLSVASISSNRGTNGDEVILVDTSASAVTVTLSSADAVSGHEVIIVDSGGNANSNNITVDTESTENIDGQSSVSINSDNGSKKFVSDGTNWFSSGQTANVGTPTTIDLGDDGNNESGDIAEIATTESQPAFSVSADKLLIDPYRLPMDGYLEPGGGVISNNGSNPNTQIDNTALKVWVRDFSGGGRIVELPARSPAFDITVSGFNGTTGGLINGSSHNTTDSYELAVIASESDDTLDPIVVGYTIESTDNTPQSSGDLPGNYDLFRPMGPARTWKILTDGSSSIRQFKHDSSGRMAPEPLTGRILDDSSPSSQKTLDLTGVLPPGVFEVEFNNMVHIGDGSGSSRTAVGIGSEHRSSIQSYEQYSSGNGSFDDFSAGSTSGNHPISVPHISSQEAKYEANLTTSRILIESLVSYREVKT